MAQFDIYSGRGEGCDFLIDLQDNMLAELATRVVAPLVSDETFGPPMRTLNPRIFIDGKPYILLTHLLAAISSNSLGKLVGSAGSQRDEIVGSIDLLFTGI
jgi:toxin CcdB